MQRANVNNVNRDRKQLIDKAHKHLETILCRKVLWLQQVILARIADSFHLNGVCLKNPRKRTRHRKISLRYSGTICYLNLKRAPSKLPIKTPTLRSNVAKWRGNEHSDCCNVFLICCPFCGDSLSCSVFSSLCLFDIF